MPTTTQQNQHEVLQVVQETQQLIDNLQEQVNGGTWGQIASKLADPAQCFRKEVISRGKLTDQPSGYDHLPVSHVHLQGVGFRSSKSLPPGTIKHLQTDAGGHQLNSKVRIVSCRLRADGGFDIMAEFF